MGGVVVLGGVRIEELARVVGVVAGLLEPDGEVGVVEALADELGVSACVVSISVWVDLILVSESSRAYRGAGSRR